MPFTFSHPAIVLPLASVSRKWFSVTGLVVGSMMPDFEYFLRMRLQGRFAHTPVGVLLFDLPIGLALAFLFHNITRNSLIDNSPTIIKARLAVFTNFNWNRYFASSWHIVAISIIIGAASHIMWDSFTHFNGFFVEMIPGLSSDVNVLGVNIHYYRILQHTSTLAGAVVIAYAIFTLPTDKTITGRFDLRYWGILAATTIATIAISISFGLSPNVFGNLVVTIISAGLLALVVTPLVMRGLTRFKPE